MKLDFNEAQVSYIYNILFNTACCSSQTCNGGCSYARTHKAIMRKLEEATRKVTQ